MHMDTEECVCVNTRLFLVFGNVAVNPVQYIYDVSGITPQYIMWHCTRRLYTLDAPVKYAALHTRVSVRVN